MKRFTQERVDPVLKDWDEEKDEGRIGHMDRVRKKLKAAANPGLHSAGLKRPGGALEKHKLHLEITILKLCVLCSEEGLGGRPQGILVAANTG